MSWPTCVMVLLPRQLPVFLYLPLSTSWQGLIKWYKLRSSGLRRKWDRLWAIEMPSFFFFFLTSRPLAETQRLKSKVVWKAARWEPESDSGRGMTSEMPAACPAKHLSESHILPRECEWHVCFTEGLKKWKFCRRISRILTYFQRSCRSCILCDQVSFFINKHFLEQVKLL